MNLPDIEIRLLGALPLLAVLAACSGPAEQQARAADEAGQSVTIMTFNAQNLFDNIDDPGKDDKAYLPIEAKQDEAHIAACNEIKVRPWREECLHLDWTDEAVDHKLATLAATIKQVNDGRGADIIAWQEVENVAILDRLRTEHLADSNYGPAILVEGDDTRGIDLAFFSRLPVVGTPVLHPLDMTAFAAAARDTRGVLQATFELPDGSLLTGFAVHFPNPGHPTEMRVAAYRHLETLRDALPDPHNVFAAGDFNTTSREDAERNMLERFVRPNWTAAHDYCDGCPGTYYYRRDDTWSFLDMILFSPARGENTTWRIRADSARIANQNPAQIKAPGIPKRYDAESRSGVSDHWPLVAELEPTEKQ